MGMNCECGGTVVVLHSRGHEYANCNRCQRCVSLETLFNTVNGLRSELARLTKREGEWREAMPRCQAQDLDGEPICTAPATRETPHLMTFRARLCDEHSQHGVWHDLPYAHLIREGM